MKKFTRRQLIDMWIEFYKEKQHIRIKNSSIIPENDASVLFTTAGMHPLVPYLLGETHPAGKRLTNFQRCIRTGDIDEVGDNCHLTFFEMMGNWSLGDYFKKEKTRWTFEFLTSPKYLGLKLDQIAVTCFGGDENAPKDEETANLWESYGLDKERIYFLSKEHNWWEINRGPCGPDNEVFLDNGQPKCSENCSPACHCGKFMELGNDVYMQYNKIDDHTYIPATQKNVDTGFGLERNLMILNNVKSIYLTEIFTPVIELIEKLSNKKYNDEGDEFTKSFRVVADHIRSAVVILGDVNGITPSNTDAGYVLRRLIRKAIRHANILGVPNGNLGGIASIFIDLLKDDYPEFEQNRNKILEELKIEEDKFQKTISFGIKEFDKVILGIEKHKEFASKTGEKVENIISGKSAFRLYETFGFPLEMTIEMAKEKGYSVDIDGYNEAYENHQETARLGSTGHFKGGLADDGEKTTRLHTAVHLMLAGLRKYLGENVYQRGSNITSERARFDFSYDSPLTSEQIKQVEDYVNKAIADKVDVECSQMSVEDARKCGALGIFDNKYGDIVKVYKIGNYSHEICGGPHAKNTGELGQFKIIKECSSSAGVRRIKCVLE